MSDTRIRLTARQHADLRRHLFPGDGMEAVAVALCGRAASLASEILLFHRIELVPYGTCTRRRDRIDWPPTVVERFFREAAEHDLAIVKVHSHPSGYGGFSRTDDDSDFNLFESVYGWVDGDRPHASAIMLPDGRMRARAVLAGGAFAPVRHVEVVGDDVVFWSDEPESTIPVFVERHAQLFGSGTTALLGRLRVAVVGCSGTGSPVIEQLVRLGVGVVPFAVELWSGRLPVSSVNITPLQQLPRRAGPARRGRSPGTARRGSLGPAGSAVPPPPARSPPSVESSDRHATA